MEEDPLDYDAIERKVREQSQNQPQEMDPRKQGCLWLALAFIFPIISAVCFPKLLWYFVIVIGEGLNLISLFFLLTFIAMIGYAIYHFSQCNRK